MRLLSLALAGWLVAGLAFADSEAESFCSSELSAMFETISAERGEAAKQSLLNAHRDEVLSHLKVAEGWDKANVVKEAAKLPYDEYVAFLKEYVTRVEEKADWKDGKIRLVSTLHSVIRDAKGTEATKRELLAQVDESSIVSLTAYLTLMESASEADRAYYRNFLPNVCGPDALMPGGIAFPVKGRKVFAFCPGALLRATVLGSPGKWRWADGIQIESILFTAFHEFGHLLGADASSRFRPMHDKVMSCLSASTAPFGRNYESEVLADFWGATTLIAAIKERPALSTRETIELVALNLSALKNGSIFSPHHPPFGARQQIVLGQVCRQLLGQPGDRLNCHLNLAE
jgi:hypothetical protein